MELTLILISTLSGLKKLKKCSYPRRNEPKSLLDTEGKMLSEATKYIEAFKDIPYVFNLGHGLLPETDPDKVGKLVNFYRKF